MKGIEMKGTKGMKGMKGMKEAAVDVNSTVDVPWASEIVFHSRNPADVRCGYSTQAVGR